MNKRMKLLTGVITGSTVVLLGSGYLVYRSVAVPPTEYVQAADGDENHYYELYTVTKQEPTSIDGKVSLTTDQVYYINPELGELNHLFVKDGQKVKKGETLFNYRQEKVTQEIEDAQRNVRRLMRNRQEAIQQLADMTGKTYDNYGNELVGYWAANGQYYYEVAADTKTTKESGFKEIIGPGEGNYMPTNEGEASIQELNDQIEDLQIQVERLENQDQLNVKAKADGVVKVDRDGEDNPSTPLVRVVSNKVSIVGEVGEYDFYALREDMPVKVHVNAENRDIEGRLVSFDDVPKSQMPTGQEDALNTTKQEGTAGNSRYGFTVAIDEFIQPGYSVKVQIGLDGVMVPQDAQVTDAKGDPIVFVYRDGKAHKVSLTMDQQGTSKVAVNGIKEGDQLILNPYNLKDGQDVTIMDPNSEE